VQAFAGITRENIMDRLPFPAGFPASGLTCDVMEGTNTANLGLH